VSEPEKPLHVRVAEVLGIELCQCLKDDVGRSIHGTCWNNTGFEGLHERGTCWSCNKTEFVRRYDTDWSATGPLIEKFMIRVVPSEHRSGWWAYWFDRDSGHDLDDGASIPHNTALFAVCSLLLAMAKAGKLEVKP
jgi:hypothetical protein